MLFDILKRTPYGRKGIIRTEHGIVETPAFVFCGTHGSIKGLPMYNLETPILLCNAFHLRSQTEVIANAGGIHKFIRWNGPIVTDSGGYQVMSMGYGSVSNEIKGVRSKNRYMRDINEDGCFFKNPIDGQIEYFNAERSIDIQCEIGVDLAVCFDECTVSSKGYDYIKKSMERSHRWCLRSLNRFKERRKSHQYLYGLVHGGTYENLRKDSVEFNKQHDFDCWAIGGTLGKNTEEMYRIVNYTAGLMRDVIRPIHLLGIGRKVDVMSLVKAGIDTFDCVEPTRIGRHGTALTVDDEIRLDLRRACYKYDYTVLDNECECSACVSKCTKAYIHYLLTIGEMSAISMIVEHNIYIMNLMMRRIREKIDMY